MQKDPIVTSQQQRGPRPLPARERKRKLKKVTARVWTRGRCPTDQARWRDAAASWLTRTKLGLVGARSTVTAQEMAGEWLHHLLKEHLGHVRMGTALGLGSVALRRYATTKGRVRRSLSSPLCSLPPGKRGTAAGGNNGNKMRIGCHPFPDNTYSPLARDCGSHGSILRLTPIISDSFAMT